MNNIVPDPDASKGSHRTGVLEGITADKIESILGFAPNVADDPDKVRYSWAFTVNGYKCAIWDYKGSYQYNSFSTYGPASVLRSIFPDHYKGTFL